MVRLAGQRDDWLTSMAVRWNTRFSLLTNILSLYIHNIETISKCFAQKLKKTKLLLLLFFFKNKSAFHSFHRGSLASLWIAVSIQSSCNLFSRAHWPCLCIINCHKCQSTSALGMNSLCVWETERGWQGGAQLVLSILIPPTRIQTSYSPPGRGNYYLKLILRQ